MHVCNHNREKVINLRRDGRRWRGERVGEKAVTTVHMYEVLKSNK